MYNNVYFRVLGQSIKASLLLCKTSMLDPIIKIVIRMNRRGAKVVAAPSHYIYLLLLYFKNIYSFELYPLLIRKESGWFI